MTAATIVKLRNARSDITNPVPKPNKGMRPWVVSDYRLGTRKRRFFATFEEAQEHCDRITEHYQMLAAMRTNKIDLLHMVGGWGLLNEMLCLKYNTNLCDVALQYMRDRQRQNPGTPSLNERERNLFSMLAAAPKVLTTHA